MGLAELAFVVSVAAAAAVGVTGTAATEATIPNFVVEVLEDNVVKLAEDVKSSSTRFGSSLKSANSRPVFDPVPFS